MMLSEILYKNNIDGIKNYMTPYIDKIISLFQKLEDNLDEDYYETLIRLEFKKWDYLIKEGTLPRSIWFIEKGIARKFINRDGEEINQHFFCTGEFVFLFEDLILSLPTNQNIQFLDDSVVVAVKWEGVEHLKNKYPIIHQIESLIMASYIKWLEKRINMIQHNSAKNKYQYFIKTQSHLLDIVPHHYIASYLDITRETLSRIRTEYKKEKM